MYEDSGNKCGKCQNHDFEVLKKGHARDCPFKKCNCLKCRLLDARSDILQVISGKETKLKGTKKDPNCGFCQNHGVKILRKGHVRSCGFGQERHFRLDNCFDCEVHYIRNEVNRLQIKMRRAMREDRTLSEEQRKTAREAITREEVEKVRNMARIARERREDILGTQQTRGETSATGGGGGGGGQSQVTLTKRQQSSTNNSSVWRPWSQHQVGGTVARIPRQLAQPRRGGNNNNNHHHSHQRIVAVNPSLPTAGLPQPQPQSPLLPAFVGQDEPKTNGPITIAAAAASSDNSASTIHSPALVHPTNINHEQEQQQQQQQLLNTLSLFRLISQFAQTFQPQS